MRPLRRRVVEDGQRHESRELNQRRPPLDVEREAEKVSDRVPIASHRDVHTETGNATVML